MKKGLFCCKSFFGVEFQTLTYKVKHGLVVCRHCLVQGFRFRYSVNTYTWLFNQKWTTVCIEVMFSLSWLRYYRLSRYSDKFHLIFKQLLFVVAWEQWLSCKKLCNYTTKRPNVNFRAVRNSENNFWSPIESTLNICICLFTCFTTWTEIDDFYCLGAIVA